MAGHAIKASLAAAAPVSLAYGVLYGSALAFLGWAVGLFAGLVTFLIAICLAPLFLAARSRVREPWYFVLHLIFGALLGVLIASLDSRADSIAEIYASRETTVPLASSLSAWAYLFLFDTRSRPGQKALRIGSKLNLPIFVIAVAALSYIPISRPYIEDDACHNVLRDQRSSNRPVEQIRLSLPVDVEAELKAYYMAFALKHDLRTRGHKIHKSSAQTSMCNERVTIRAGGFFEGRHGISVYEMSPDSEWQILAEEIVCDFKARWPDGIQFSDGGGYKHDNPQRLEAYCYDTPLIIKAHPTAYKKENRVD